MEWSLTNDPKMYHEQRIWYLTNYSAHSLLIIVGALIYFFVLYQILNWSTKYVSTSTYFWLHCSNQIWSCFKIKSQFQYIYRLFQKYYNRGTAAQGPKIESSMAFVSSAPYWMKLELLKEGNKNWELLTFPFYRLHTCLDV